MQDESARQVVKSGYDRIANQYLASKDPHDPILLSTLDGLARDLPQTARVLDLGCGAGIPATRWLAERLAVIGVDLSSRQLSLAREHVPAADFILADMAEIHFPPESFDAVVSFFAIIHVPRSRQPALVRRIHRWLKPGGAFLATWAMTEWEGAEANWEGWGSVMWWSHFGRDDNLRMLRESGFRIESAEPRHTGREDWLWALARKWS